MKLKDILASAGRPVVTIDGSASLEDAISRMSQNNSSSLIAIRNNNPAGILTEHDIVKELAISKGHNLLQMQVERAMTNKLICAAPNDNLDGAISLMLKANIRHLPVMENGVVIAMLHLCDLVHYKLEVLASEIAHLEEYLKDLHGAMTD